MKIINKYKLSIVLTSLCIIYLVGAVGILFSCYSNQLIQLTPLILILSLASVLYFHTEWNQSFCLFLALTFGISLGAEVIGVNTGYLFGHYSYTSVLGFQLFSTPLIIGINWLLCVYCVGSFIDKWSNSIHLKAIIGAIILVLFDLVLEPVATHYLFWQWQDDIIPLSNFVSWGLLSYLLLLLFFKLPFHKENKAAFPVFLLMLLFFLVLLIA